MDEQEIARRLLHNFGIRIESEMSRYARRQLDRASGAIDGGGGGGGGQIATFPVMGAHARTGVAVRAMIDVNRFRAMENARDTY